MEDAEVIATFLDEGIGHAFGPSLHVEGDTMLLDGWWPLAYRVSARTILVRDEEAPSASTAPADLANALTVRGRIPVGTDLPAITVLTYVNLDLGYTPWVLWSSGLETGEADLNSRATADSFLQDGLGPVRAFDPGDAVRVRGARRTAGAPTRVVLVVGMSDEQCRSLGRDLDDCRLECRRFDEIAPDDCGSLLPDLVLIDATGNVGSAFVAALLTRRNFRGPVVAITTDAQMHVGADATLDPAAPDGWLELLRGLLDC